MQCFFRLRLAWLSILAVVHGLLPLSASSQTAPVAAPDVNRPSITIPAAGGPAPDSVANPQAAVNPLPNSANANTGSAVSAPSGYQLSSNDAIGVEVFGEEDLRTSARLNAEGNVSLPLIGSVHVGGLTMTQATQRITELYGKDYLVNPR